jgi:hypothetical protein
MTPEEYETTMAALKKAGKERITWLKAQAYVDKVKIDKQLVLDIAEAKWKTNNVMTAVRAAYQRQEEQAGRASARTGRVPPKGTKEWEAYMADPNNKTMAAMDWRLKRDIKIEKARASKAAPPDEE